MIIVSNNSYSQFGIQNKIKNKYKEKYTKEGKKHAEKQLDKAEDKGMEEADKGLNHATDSLAPQMEKAEEQKQKGEEYVSVGLGKYQNFVDNYDETVYTKNPEDYKRYAFESAHVEYKINDSDKETKELFIDMGGYKYAEYLTEKSRKKTEKTASILIGHRMITVDFQEKTAVEMNNPMAFLLANPDKDWEESSERILKHMGYEIIGSEKVLGYDCDIWKQGSHRMWVWHGLSLKSKIGKQTEEAINVEIGENIDPKVFEAPNDFEVTIVDEKDLFPEVDTTDLYYDKSNDKEYNELLDEIENMSWSEYKAKVLEEDPNANLEEAKQAYLYLRQEARMRHKK